MYQFSLDFVESATVKRPVSSPQHDSPWPEVTDLEPEQLTFEFFYQAPAERRKDR